MLQKHKTILLIDDEAPQRAFMRRVLEDAGYNVLEGADHDEALIAALRETPGQLGGAAVLCPTLREVDRYYRLLTKAGLQVQRLEAYDGAVTDACKIGTYHRVKGLEFKQVFLPCYDHSIRELGQSGAAAQEHGQLARRRLFVAITRARDHVWLGTAAAG